jgi:DNA helicase HerA-like ATPase
LINRFRAAESWHIFSREGLNISDIIQGGKIVSLDLSYLSYITAEWNVRVLPVAIISRYIARKATVMARLRDISEPKENLLEDFPLVWLFIDEGHQFLPSNFTTPATYPLLEWIRQGRHPGLTLVLATQMPRRLHSDAISLCDIAISHRITAKMDLDALRSIMHTYAGDISSRIASLPILRGAALIVDDNSETVNMIRVRPRMSRHAGEDACIFNLFSKPLQ